MWAAAAALPSAASVCVWHRCESVCVCLLIYFSVRTNDPCFVNALLFFLLKLGLGSNGIFSRCFSLVFLLLLVYTCSRALGFSPRARFLTPFQGLIKRFGAAAGQRMFVELLEMRSDIDRSSRHDLIAKFEDKARALANGGGGGSGGAGGGAGGAGGGTSRQKSTLASSSAAADGDDDGDGGDDGNDSDNDFFGGSGKSKKSSKGGLFSFWS
jgi:hypothetical protein